MVWVLSGGIWCGLIEDCDLPFHVCCLLLSSLRHLFWHLRIGSNWSLRPLQWSAISPYVTRKALAGYGISSAGLETIEVVDSVNQVGSETSQRGNEIALVKFELSLEGDWRTPVNLRSNKQGPDRLRRYIRLCIRPNRTDPRNYLRGIYDPSRTIPIPCRRI